MAEVRLTSSLPVVSPSASARADTAVRAAQRAFFDAALNASQAASPARPAAKATITEAPAAAGRASPASAQDRAAGPQRGMRPGSLLDIRV